MIKVYTPKVWLSVFGGSPSLIIRDDGYIFSADQYYKIITGSPIGKIDYEKGFIYDKHYNDLFPTPIAYTKTNGDVIEIRKYGDSLFASPILYIQNDRLYTPEEYFRLFGGAASGYIKRETKADDISDRVPTSRPSESGSGAEAVGAFPKLMSLLGVVLLGGMIYILSDEGRLADATTTLALAVNAVAAIALLFRLFAGKIHWEWNGKHFFKCLLIGVGIYVAACALFILLGLGSNIGSGHALSDKGTDQLELSAMLLGVPFVLEGFFCSGPKKAASNSTPASKPAATRSAPPAPKATPKPAPARTSATASKPASARTSAAASKPASARTFAAAPKTVPNPAAPTGSVQDAKNLVFKVMVQEYGQTAVFLDALIGRNTAEQADLMVRIPGHCTAVFFIVSSPADTQGYKRAQTAGRLWENRGACWFIAFEKDCRDPEKIRKWLKNAMAKTVKA